MINDDVVPLDIYIYILELKVLKFHVVLSTIFRQLTLTLNCYSAMVSDEDKRIINHSRKLLLVNNQQVWIKKESGLFNVTMGAYEVAEVCEPIGSLIYQLSKKYNKKHINLYRK